MNNQKRNRYVTSISKLVWDSDALNMLDACKNKKEMALLSLAWITGGRASELMNVKVCDIKPIGNTYVLIKLDTLKKRNTEQRFQTTERTLRYNLYGDRENVFLTFIVMRVKSLDPDCYFISGQKKPLTTSWARKTMKRISIKGINRHISLYHLRHSLFTQFIKNGGTLSELMHLKGASDINSCKPYIHATDFIMPKLDRKDGIGVDEGMGFARATSQLTSGVEYLAPDPKEVGQRMEEYREKRRKYKEVKE
jgi:site-specific recombinase XerD